MWLNIVFFFFLVSNADSFSAATVADTEYEPLRLFVICKRGLLKDKFQVRLQEALKWFEQALQVAKYNVSDEDVKQIRLISKEVVDYGDEKIGMITITAPKKAFSIEYESPEIDKLLKYAIPIYLHHDEKDCRGRVLASASPIYSPPNNRPIAIQLNFCPENINAHDVFNIFRHEIFHGLGYGQSQNKDHIVEETAECEWKGHKENYTRRYLQTADSSSYLSIRQVFNCYDDKKVYPISDDPGWHLHEAFFGNELMTSSSDKNDIFSFISADIIERSYTGSVQWYKVNRTFIAPEADKYIWPKYPGCKAFRRICTGYFYKRYQEEILYGIPDYDEDSR